MKRFLLGLAVGTLAVSVLWDGSRANPPAPCPPPAPVPPGPVLLVQHDPNGGFPPVPDGRQSFQDIPVPIVPGTRTTEARIQAPRPEPGARRHRQPPVSQHTQAKARPASHVRVITGRLSATEERAVEDVRRQVDKAVADWLGPDVDSSWQPPASLRGPLVQKTEVRSVQKEIDGERVTLFEASQTVDFSPDRRTALVAAYQRELVARRLAILAGALAFVLACLAALAGYIRADEATKGYYTNRLRLVSAAAVGAAGALIYQFVA